MRPVQYAAGHYLSKGAHGNLRFHEWNIQKQCNRNCNKGKSGNQVEYRKELINRIGLEGVEFLEGPHDIQDWSLDDLKEVVWWYKLKLKSITVDGVE